MNRLLLLLPLLFTQLLIAQNRSQLIDQIEQLAKDKQSHLQEIDEIDRQTETLKLNRIQLDLKANGLPAHDASEPIVFHTALALKYSEQHEQAEWVAHIVNRDVLEGKVKRTNDFRTDSLVESQTAVTEDYWDSGYDRGHLAPSADFRWSKKALSESYFYSNMSPQLPGFNRGIWAELENEVREWAIFNEELYVVTGGVLEDGLPTVGKQNQVSIPKFYYKVLFDYQAPDYKGIGFVLPHREFEGESVLKYAVSIDSVERLTGLDFFADVPEKVENEVEANLNVEDWPLNAVWGESNEAAPPIDLEKGQVSAENAKHYVGHKCTVCGTVVSARFNQNGKTDPTYINLDKKFPNQVFTLVIYGKDRMNFSYIPDQYLKDKRICIRGKVSDFRGTPQMVITDESKIEVVE